MKFMTSPIKQCLFFLFWKPLNNPNVSTVRTVGEEWSEFYDCSCQGDSNFVWWCLFLTRETVRCFVGSWYRWLVLRSKKFPGFTADLKQTQSVHSVKTKIPLGFYSRKSFRVFEATVLVASFGINQVIFSVQLLCRATAVLWTNWLSHGQRRVQQQNHTHLSSLFFGRLSFIQKCGATYKGDLAEGSEMDWSAGEAATRAQPVPQRPNTHKRRARTSCCDNLLRLLWIFEEFCFKFFIYFFILFKVKCWKRCSFLQRTLKQKLCHRRNFTGLNDLLTVLDGLKIVKLKLCLIQTLILSPPCGFLTRKTLLTCHQYSHENIFLKT